jgi:hypothetical protein
MRISNKRNSSLSSSWRSSARNLPLRSRCNKYNSLCNRRSPVIEGEARSFGEWR